MLEYAPDFRKALFRVSTAGVHVIVAQVCVAPLDFLLRGECSEDLTGIARSLVCLHIITIGTQLKRAYCREKYIYVYAMCARTELNGSCHLLPTCLVLRQSRSPVSDVLVPARFRLAPHPSVEHLMQIIVGWVVVRPQRLDLLVLIGRQIVFRRFAQRAVLQVALDVAALTSGVAGVRMGQARSNGTCMPYKYVHVI